jgi:hypothetical protein
VKAPSSPKKPSLSSFRTFAFDASNFSSATFSGVIPTSQQLGYLGEQTLWTAGRQQCADPRPQPPDAQLVSLLPTWPGCQPPARRQCDRGLPHIDLFTCRADTDPDHAISPILTALGGHAVYDQGVHRAGPSQRCGSPVTTLGSNALILHHLPQRLPGIGHGVFGFAQFRPQFVALRSRLGEHGVALLESLAQLTDTPL